MIISKIPLLFIGFCILNSIGECATLVVATSDIQPILKRIKSSSSDNNLLINPDFEQIDNNTISGWNKYGNGYEIARKEGRNNSTAIFVNNDVQSRSAGASQNLTLNRNEITPIIVSGWSKSENVNGAPDNNYSIYVDLIYNDDTPLWGQTANFRCGTHNWEKREVVIMPEKPVKKLTVYCLFRGHSGKVWFDDISLTELKPDADSFLWQGVPLILNKVKQDSKTKSQFNTKDGLGLVFKDGYANLTLDKKDTYKSKNGLLKPFGFLIRDVADDSDVYLINDTDCKPLNLKLSYIITPKENYLEITGKITDLKSQDRAITIAFALPVEADGWQWWDDIRRGRTIKGRAEFQNTVSVRCGSTGTMSLYPLAAISKENSGIAIGIDILSPANYRICYHPGLKQFFIVYDFGLVSETKNFPGSAPFKFVIYRFNGEYGFRAALQKYMEIFPQYFEVRSKDQGIWMPFVDVNTVKGWQDFGFKYHEGNNNVLFDDANGILSFRYTEPMTWWMPMDKSLPRTFETAIQVRDQILASKNPSQKNPAQVTLTSSMYDENGKPALAFRDEPWCNGAIWSLNPNPYLSDKPNFVDWHWSEDTLKKLYGENAKGTLDGEYLDSLEGYVTTDLNYRREHFIYTTVPLTFSMDTKKPALYKGFAVFEITKWVSEKMRKMEKLTFANGVPYRFSFLCALLDVMGTETDWNPGGKWNSPPDSRLCLWRSMAGAKPYLLLMNTRYENFPTNLVEKYFQRCAFYGFYPSMFSHNASENVYWQNPDWYNRDRYLFKKYIPMIKRMAESGWQPITRARCKNDKVLLEQFGDTKNGTFYITAFNSNPINLDTEITIEVKNPVSSIKELISGNQIKTIEKSNWTHKFLPEETAIFEISVAR